MSGVKVERFGVLPDGREAHAYTLAAGNMTMKVTDYGCRILSLLAPDREGKMGDVVLGHRTLEEYFGADFHGTAIGRWGNRIGGARFALEGKEYRLAQNDGENSLHGGPGGFHQALWQADFEDGPWPEITFSLESPDGEEGFPGNLKAEIAYKLTAEGALHIRYSAVSDQATPFNPTNHSFFNLSGDPQRDVLDTVLTINAQKVTEVTDALIPTGGFIQVDGGPLDFRSPKPLGQDMFAEDHLIQLCGGFDHNFCPQGSGFRKIAEAREPKSGRVMEVFTDLPGVQLYTFNRPPIGVLGKDGQQMGPHTAFCLETQFYPDTVNHQNFPAGILQKDTPFVTETEYKFSVSQE